jgi:hypothetical protein
MFEVKKFPLLLQLLIKSDIFSNLSKLRNYTSSLMKLNEGPSLKTGGITGSAVTGKGIKRKLDAKSYEVKYDAIVTSTVDSRYLEFDGIMENIRVNRSSTQEELLKYRKCSLFNDERETTRAKF